MGTGANPSFVEWAEDYVLLLHVTSYVFSDPHHDLFAERGGFGFPYLAVLDAEGQWLAGEHGVLTLEKCDQLAATARELQALTQAEDDGAARVKVFTTRLRQEALSLEEARAGRVQLEGLLSDEQAVEIDQLVINREIASELAALRRQYPEHSALSRATAPKAAALFRAGKVPTNRLAPHYMQAVFGYAQATKDRQLFADALAKFDELFAENEQYTRALDRYRKQLDAWK